jgi:hypothetical protein
MNPAERRLGGPVLRAISSIQQQRECAVRVATDQVREHRRKRDPVDHPVEHRPGR